MAAALNLVASGTLLAKYADAYASGDRHALSDAIDLFRGPHGVGRLLESMLADDAWLCQVHARSYWHPNGFLKLILVAADSFQLRLHVWRPAAESVAVFENVHSHRWDFSSLIFLGGYRYQEYTRLDDGDPFHAYVYQGHAGVTSYSLAPVGVRRLRCVLDAELAEGTNYTLTAEALHRVVVDPRDGAASLVLQGPRRPGMQVHVFAVDEIESGATMPLRPLSRSELTAQVDSLLSRIA